MIYDQNCDINRRLLSFDTKYIRQSVNVQFDHLIILNDVIYFILGGNFGWQTYKFVR